MRTVRLSVDVSCMVAMVLVVPLYSYATGIRSGERMAEKVTNEVGGKAPSDAAEVGAEQETWDAWEPPRLEVPEKNAFETYYRRAWEGYHSREFREAVNTLVGGGDLPTEKLARLVEQCAPIYSLLEAGLEAPCLIPPGLEVRQWLSMRDEVEGDKKGKGGWLAAIIEADAIFARSFLREGARLFARRSVVREKRGDLDGAVKDAVRCFQLGADLSTGRTVVPMLTALAADLTGIRRLRDLMPALSAKQCTMTIKTVVPAIRNRPTLTEVFRWEGIIFKMLAQEVLSQSDAELVGQLQEQGIDVRAEAINRQLWWDEVCWYYEGLVAEMGKPYQKREPVPMPDNPLTGLEFLDESLVLRAMKTLTAHRARLWLVVVQLAATAYGKEHGRLPGDLAALCPQYLEEIPKDPFTGQSLQMIGDGQRATIYSVGPNGTDDTTELREEGKGGDDIVVMVPPAPRKNAAKRGK